MFQIKKCKWSESYTVRNTKSMERNNSPHIQIYDSMQNLMFRRIPPFKQQMLTYFCLLFHLRNKSHDEICGARHPGANFAVRNPCHAFKSPFLLQKDAKRSQLSQPSRGQVGSDSDRHKRPASFLGREGMWDDLLLQFQWTALLPKVRKWNFKVCYYICRKSLLKDHLLLSYAFSND